MSLLMSVLEFFCEPIFGKTKKAKQEEQKRLAAMSPEEHRAYITWCRCQYGR